LNEDHSLISTGRLDTDPKKAAVMAVFTAVHMDFRKILFTEPGKGLADFAAAIF
jgi:hypothetical protein